MIEQEKYFEERTKAHILAVQKNSKKIAKNLPEYKDLVKITEKHDASKLVEPEKTPYIALTWGLKNGKAGKETRTDAIISATLAHILHNAHHPEFWNKKEATISNKDRDKSKNCLDVSAMPNIALAEMIADWQAVSEELKKNTAREWFEKQRNVRWKFTAVQEKTIDKLLKVFEDGLHKKGFAEWLSLKHI